MESLEMSKAFSDFFSNKRIVLTGHTGFKGSWTSHVLAYLGAELHGIALKPEVVSHFNAAGTSSLIHNNLIDINDAEAIGSAIRHIKPHVIMHFAAQPLVRRSYDDPIDTLQTNIMGSANVMQAALSCQSKPIVAMITSDKCYENQEREIGYLEHEPMGGHDPYSASKGAAELVIQGFARSFFKPRQQSILSLRGGNVIGGGDWAQDRIIPDIVGALTRSQQPKLRNPSATRPWQHVLDVINGYLAAIRFIAYQPPGTYDCFNIGPMPENVMDVRTLAERACQLWGNGLLPSVVEDSRQPYEAKLLQLDITKALTQLDWVPLYGFDAALAHTMSWYRVHQDGQDMFEFTRTQIANFFHSESKI